MCQAFFNFKDKENYTKTVIEMDVFLESLGYLKGKPSLQNKAIAVDPPASRQ